MRDQPSLYRQILVGFTRLQTKLIVAAFITAIPFGPACSVTIGGPFRLQAADGQVVTDQTFSGVWLLVYFGYTSCPDTCPTALIEIAKTLQKLGRDAVRIRPVFITIDPKRDTSDVMGGYTASFDPRILGLTGTADEVENVVREYGVYAQRHTEQADLIDHSTYIYLMNPDGIFVRAFDKDSSADQMAKVLRSSMDQDRSNQSRVVHEE